MFWPGFSLSSTPQPCPAIPGLCVTLVPLIGPYSDPNVQADVPAWPQSSPTTISLPGNQPVLVLVTAIGANPDSCSWLVLGLASVLWICLVIWALLCADSGHHCWLSQAKQSQLRKFHLIKFIANYQKL